MIARIAGALLLSLATLPLYALLGPETGLAGAATRQLAQAYASLAFAGVLMLVIPGIITARLGVPARLLARAEAALLRPAPVVFAALVALCAGTAAALFSLLVLERQPNLVDAMAQLQHARYFAAGQLAAPAGEWGAFWHIQQSLVTAAGWVSQYPPGHVALLALGFRLGAVWLVGPVLLAAAVFITALLAERLLAHERTLARVAALLTALSPFLIAHAGAYMSHTAAAAFGAFVIYAALRAPASLWWAVAGGVALGALFATRPLSAVSIGAAAAVTLWLHLPARSPRVCAGRLAAAAAGALPLVVLVALYNARFFGSPFTFGYTAAQGPAGALGFGIDPWGNRYGITEAIAYTAAELNALNSALLESPLPLVAVIGLYLLLVTRLDRVLGTLLAWAAAPLLVHLAYWHHGIFMGPRMLNETAPAWILLAVLAAARLPRQLPVQLRALPAYSPRAFLQGMILVAFIAGPLVFGPLRLAAYRGGTAGQAGADAQDGALVFVHGGWTARLAMSLAASGMRLDSVETALRQNSTCAVQHYVAARAAGSPATLDFAPRAVDLPPQLLLSPGNTARVWPGERWSAACAREAAADRNGVIDVSPLLWRGDLPGLARGRAMYVRDLGPGANEQLLRTLPQRTPYVLMTPTPAASPVLVSYDAGMAALWSDAQVLAHRSAQ